MTAIRLETDDDSTLSARDPRLDTWRTFLMAHALLTRRLDEDLRSEEGLTLGEYSALLQVAEAPGRALRMNQLATGIFLSRSGVTRLIDRLEADGLIERSTCTDDGRGALAVLTDAGLARLRAAAATHLRGIDQYFLAVVPRRPRAAGRHVPGDRRRSSRGRRATRARARPARRSGGHPTAPASATK